MRILSFHGRRIFYFGLVGITGIGIVLRLYHLNYQSLWYDELHSIIPTDPRNSLSSIIEYCKGDQPPAFFLYLHYFFKLFGYSEFTGRLASAFLGIVAIPVMFFFGKEIKDAEVGFVAGVVTSFNYMHIYYSQELRFYSMAFLFSALSFLYFIRAFKRTQIFDFGFYVLFTVALLYTHYYGLVIFGSQALLFFALLWFRRDKTFVFASISSGVLILILFSPWMPVIVSDLKITSFWLQRPEANFILTYFYFYFGKDAITTGVFVFLTVLFFKPIFSKGLENGQQPIYLMLLGWLLVSYMIPYVKSLTGTPVLHVRYTIVALPAWFLIFGLGWVRIRNGWWKYGLIPVLVLSMVINLVFVRRHYVRVDKQQFREASALVQRINGGAVPVYSQYPWHFNFYFRRGSHGVLDLNGADLSKTDSFWLLYAEFFSPEEKTDMVNPLLKDFVVAQTYDFHKTSALLLRRIRK